jgi:ATP-dependent 26S proteasome regulatory subunit
MLFNKIRLGAPNIWVKTQDPFKVFDQITSVQKERNYFTLDFTKGFSKYSDGKFKPFLIPNPAHAENPDLPQYVAPHDPILCIQYLTSQEQGLNTLVLFLAGQGNDFISALSGFLLMSQKNYRDSFWNDSLSSLPLQLIFITQNDPPEEYASLLNVVEDSYPIASELYTIVNHISSSPKISVHEREVKNIVHSGLGLTESQFVDLCLNSLIEKGTVDSKYIYDQKMSSLKKNGILEIIQPKISFNDIGGLDNIKDIIRRTALMWKNRELTNSYGIVPIRRLLMVGIPGTGKSALCQATANELGLDLARTGISQVMNSFIGQSESNMRSVFKQIQAMSPLCVWIDEFGRDLSGGSSSSHVDGGTTDRVHGEFLTGLQELPDDTFLMCAANSLDALRPEMLRADRFDKIMFVGMPSLSEREHIFRIYLRDIQTDHDFDFSALALASQFMTGAEINSLIREVKFFVVSSEMRPINTSDILDYIPKIKNTIWNKHQDMVKSMYQYALSQWDWASHEQMEDAKYLLSKSFNPKSSSTIVWK